MRPARRAAAVAIALAAAFAGCAIEDPYADRYEKKPDGPAASETTASEAAGEDVDVALAGAGTTPESTLRAAALLAGNWTSETSGDVYRRLAALSVGAARVQFAQTALNAEQNPLQRGTGARSTGTVLAVTVTGTGASRRSVVVTRERIVTDALQDLPAEHRVTLARVELHGDVWAISNWEPQP